MRKTIVWVLIVSVLFQFTGCYTFESIQLNSYSDLSESEFETKDIRIKLSSGEKFVSKAYKHTYNDRADDFILGQGTVYSPANPEGEIFSGKVYKNRIDSLTVENNFFTLWLKNKDVIKIEKTGFMEVNGDSAKGLLLIDNMKLRIIPNEEIVSLESNEYNSTLTGLTLVGAAVVSVVAILMYYHMSNMHFDFGYLALH